MLDVRAGALAIETGLCGDSAQEYAILINCPVDPTAVLLAHSLRLVRTAKGQRF